MRIAAVMTRGAECTRPDATLEEAAQRMKSLDVGSLPVCDNDRIVGIITDRDITIRAVADGKDPRSCTVRDAMTPHIFCCNEDEDVEAVAQLMKDKQVRRVPVLDGNKRLVGIVSLGDLAIEIHNERLVGEALECISEPAMSH
jgi:CBS domain-containing protein